MKMVSLSQSYQILFITIISIIFFKGGFSFRLPLPSVQPQSTVFATQDDSNLQLVQGSTVDASVQLMPTVYGICHAGFVYQISSIDDLRNRRSELECIFHAGLTPQQIPRGALLGSLLSFINTALFSPLIESMWHGKFETQYMCQPGIPKDIGWNNVLNYPIMPFMTRVGPLMDNLPPGDFIDKKNFLILDYTADIEKECSQFHEYVQENNAKLEIHRDSLESIYPFNQIMDALRIVGKQSDGGTIYLGKSYLRDYFSKDLQLQPIMYFVLVNYDPQIQILNYGQPLPPTEISFQYSLPGIRDLAIQLIPAKEFLDQPEATSQKVVVQVVSSTGNIFRFIAEMSNKTNTLSSDSKTFQDYFKHPTS